MKLGIIGLGHAFYKQINAIKFYKKLELVAVCDTDKQKLNNFEFNGLKTTNYKDMVNHCDYVLIASPPNTHLKIAKYFIKHNIGILLEKPIVTSSKQLKKLCKLLNVDFDYIDKNSTSLQSKSIMKKSHLDLQNFKSKDNTKNKFCKYYNLLHFSFGEEILWFFKNQKLNLPQKIYAFISDKYVEKSKHKKFQKVDACFQIKKSAKSLCGAYLDESINPLSAIANLFDYPKFCLLKQKKIRLDKQDYYAKSHFMVKSCPITLEVDWNKNTDDKYIDLHYADKVIRLDSMNQCVIDLSLNKVLFKASGDRMTNHYCNAFKEFLDDKTNVEHSLKLHKELLKNL